MNSVLGGALGDPEPWVLLQTVISLVGNSTYARPGQAAACTRLHIATVPKVVCLVWTM